MYSGTTFTKYSGRVLGAHQKVDRIARQHLSELLLNDQMFPSVKAILEFEGEKGPDAIKRKSPAQDEPWHYLDPFDDNDTQLVELVEGHYKALVKELKKGDQERAAFEAAWLAHGLVDGMTPAHHYPYENELVKLRGEGKETRTTWKKKLVIPGDTTRERMLNNWKMWGPKGLLMAHVSFEVGAAGVMAPLAFTKAMPSATARKSAKKDGVGYLLVKSAREVSVLGMYDEYYAHGWTPKLALQVRNKLGPTMVRTVTLAWYLAACEAGLAE